MFIKLRSVLRYLLKSARSERLINEFLCSWYFFPRSRQLLCYHSFRLNLTIFEVAFFYYRVQNVDFFININININTVKQYYILIRYICVHEAMDMLIFFQTIQIKEKKEETPFHCVLKCEKESSFFSI